MLHTISVVDVHHDPLVVEGILVDGAAEEKAGGENGEDDGGKGTDT